ncbi:MAG: hypothetical protein F6K09_13020 [Merismopedia sp. SIO2A8]|nr:hypothetical protein [Symploca sp. SIO2B6]NET49614.1 hypothetical protein [Merismopedia sp. SIO2A8]
MNKLTTNFVHSQQTTQLVEMLPAPQPLSETPASWLKDGGSPAEIILAVAVLVRALTGLLQTLFRAQHQHQHSRDKTK